MTSHSSTLHVQEALDRAGAMFDAFYDAHPHLRTDAPRPKPEPLRQVLDRLTHNMVAQNAEVLARRERREAAEGKEGFALEKQFGPANAGMLLYLKSTPNEPIPDWGASNESAMSDMKERAARQLAATKS